MAVRQYIGARYVPLYMGDWDSTKNYEPLSIVTDANGNSFTSLKDVPSGTRLTDRNFWIQTSSFSGAVDVLRRDVSDLQNDVSTLEQNVLSNFDKTDLCKLQNERMVIVGDSYERVTKFGWYVSQFLGHGFELTPLTQDAMVKASADRQVFVTSEGSKGFTGDGDHAEGKNGVLRLLQTCAANMTADEKRTTKNIAICLGIADCVYDLNGEGYNKLPNQMDRVKDYVDQNFQNAKVSLVFLGRVRGAGYETDAMKIALGTWRLQDLCAARGWEYIANSEYICYQTEDFIDSDNLHPKSGNGYAIAAYVLQGLLTGSVDVRFVPQVNYTFTGGDLIDAVSYQIKRDLDNGTTILFFTMFDLTFREAQTLNFDQRVKIGTQNAFYAQRLAIIPTMANILVNNVFRLCSIRIEFDGYDVYLRYLGSATTDNSTQAIAAKSVVPVHGLSLVLNTFYT